MKIELPASRGRRLHVSWLASLMVLLVGLCWVTPLAAQDMVGRCFDLDRGEWVPEMDVGADSVSMTLPSRVEFTGDPAPGPRRGGFKLEPAQGALASPHEIRLWDRKGDTVSVVWSNGFSGVRGEFTEEEDLLSGTVRSSWDFERPTQTARAWLRPVSCDAPHERDVSERPVPRAFILGDGRRLEVGARLDSIPDLETGRGELTRYVRDVDLFGVPDVPEIRISPTRSGQIYVVIARLPDGLDETALVSRLVSELGSAANGATTLEGERMEWHNRTTWLTLTRGQLTDGGTYYSLSLRDPTLGRW